MARKQISNTTCTCLGEGCPSCVPCIECGSEPSDGHGCQHCFGDEQGSAADSWLGWVEVARDMEVM